MAGVSTTQKSLGKATVKTAGSLTFMLWTGTDNYINLDTQDISKNYEFKSSPNKNLRSKYGPAFVLVPNGTEGYVVWVDDSTNRIRSSAAKDDGSGRWTISESYTEIDGSNATSGPTAALGLQNGQLVINIVWHDGGKSSMVLSQIHIGHTKPAYSFVSLNKDCLDSPCLVMTGRTSFLGYFSGTHGSNLGSRPFALGVDWKGGVNFDFSTTIIDKGRRSNIKPTGQYAPAIVPRGGGAYVVWYNAGEIMYIKMNIGKDNTLEWDDNSYGSFATKDNTGGSGIHAQLVQTLENGVTTDKILVAGPIVSDKTVYTNYISL